MKKAELNTSKILLIILGVLVAIIIGFNSHAVGSKTSPPKWAESIERKVGKLSEKAFQKPIEIAISVVDSFGSAQ